MEESTVAALGQLLHNVDNGVHDGFLVRRASLVPQRKGEEGEQERVLARILDAERLDSLHNDNLELVRDVAHEGGDLLHEPLDAGFVSCLQQRCDGQGGDRAVAIHDQTLHVVVALDYFLGSTHGHFVEASHSREAKGRLNTRQKHVQHRDGRAQLRVWHDALQLTNSPGGLVNHELALVTHAGVEVVVAGGDNALLRGGLAEEQGLRELHQEAGSQGGERDATCVLGDDLGHCELVRLAHFVEESQCMVLHHVVAGGNGGRDLAAPAGDDFSVFREPREAGHQGG
mmetsp:Transcript_1510/g.2260  ORF Transcript_1510/g.2260 Transcript_1510/m.2260 type:complete len:286 (+) Transcript_1510:1602-2459(+)